MRWLEKLRICLQMLLHRNRENQRLDSELQFHLDQQTAENMTSGMPPEEARHAALRSFGNPALLREQTRGTWSGANLEALLRDIRYGIRTLLRSPGFSLMAVAVMALCIGATTSLFTIVHSVLMRPLPFVEPDRLFMVYEHFRNFNNERGFNYNVVSPADYYEWRSQTHGFQDMAAWRWLKFNLSGEHAELPEVVDAVAGTWNFFPLLGVRPVLGRSFSENEDHPGANKVAILAWNIFQRRFGGDPSIVGKQIRLDANAYTIVGVLPDWFAYPHTRVQIWVPYGAIASPELLTHHDYHQSYVVARLSKGANLQAAMNPIKALQYQIHLRYPDSPVAEEAVSRPMIEDVVRDVKTPLIIILSAVGCLLLIGCLNVANLLVARSATRQKEIALRGALGATRVALIRQQMAESFLICAAGGFVGVLISLTVTKWLANVWRGLPRTEAIHVDATVLTFSCGLVCISALLAGLLPAASSTTKSIAAVLQDSSRSIGGSLSRTGLRKTLLTVEIGMTVVLLVSAGLLLKSFLRLRATNLGAATDNILTMSYGLPEKQYDKPDKVVAFNEKLLERVKQLPGVRAAGLGFVAPGAGYGGDDVFTVVEHPPIQPGEQLPDALYRLADPDYFRTLQIPLLKGRFFSPQERLERSAYIIVSQQLVQKYFRGEDPIGRHLNVPAWDNRFPNYEIIGVVGDTVYQAGKPEEPMMYFPTLAGKTGQEFSLVVRTASNPLTLSLPIQKEIAALDPGLPVSKIMTMDQIIEESTANTSFSATLILAFAILSLLLAAVGLYGVLSYLVTQRQTEIGIRIALGARREQVLGMVLVDGLRPAFIGLAIGIAGSFLTMRLIDSMLYQTQHSDPAVFASVILTLGLVTTAACAWPAWRASRLNPMQALRME